MTASVNSLIVGLGTTGLSVARHLAGRGESFVVADSRTDPPGLATLREIAPDTEVRLGTFDPLYFARFARLIVSPGVGLDEPAVRAARKGGSEIVGDIELFARLCRKPVVAITGSNGKSTVTTLVGEMAHAAGINAAVGGNLGVPALDLLDGPQADLYVLELSSFQLETTRHLAPRAATILNISPDHLDRYRSIRDYAEAKGGIYRGAEVCVVNRDDALASVYARGCGGRSIGFGIGVPPVETDYGLIERAGQPWLVRGSAQLLAERELKITGRHNTANALAALALGEAAGLPLPPMLETLRAFTGLPHRTQYVAEVKGVRYYDDSKGTNVGATLAALAGMNAPVVLIAGGQGKGQDFTPLATTVARQARAVVLIGEDARRIADTLGGTVPVEFAADMSEAVARAARLARPGDCVLLSPACASFDMFKGYAHRGDVFAAAVRRLVA